MWPILFLWEGVIAGPAQHIARVVAVVSGTGAVGTVDHVRSEVGVMRKTSASVTVS